MQQGTDLEWAIAEWSRASVLDHGRVPEFESWREHEQKSFSSWGWWTNWKPYTSFQNIAINSYESNIFVPSDRLMSHSLD